MEATWDLWIRNEIDIYSEFCGWGISGPDIFLLLPHQFILSAFSSPEFSCWYLPDFHWNLSHSVRIGPIKFQEKYSHLDSWPFSTIILLSCWYLPFSLEPIPQSSFIKICKFSEGEFILVKIILLHTQSKKNWYQMQK